MKGELFENNGYNEKITKLSFFVILSSHHVYSSIYSYFILMFIKLSYSEYRGSLERLRDYV